MDATGLPPGASLTDHGDGTATFTWDTIAGDIGNHPVTFTATDASDPTLVDSELVTLRVVDETGNVIVDNGDAGTSKSGTWYIAGAPNFYGTNSRYSSKVDATYTFVASLTPGEYQVHAWWTQYKKRRTSVPYDIQHLGGTDTVTVNQRENGGKWNLLGTYSFDTSATIVLRSLGNGSTSADAVVFVPTGGGGNAPPYWQPSVIASSTPAKPSALPSRQPTTAAQPSSTASW